MMMRALLVILLLLPGTLYAQSAPVLPASNSQLFALILVLGLMLFSIITNGVTWYLFRQIPAVVQRLQDKVDNNYERRIMSIESAQAEQKHDHDEQVELRTLLKTMNSSLNEKLDTVTLTISRLDQDLRDQSRILERHDTQLKAGEKRMDGQHASLQKHKQTAINQAHPGHLHHA